MYLFIEQPITFTVPQHDGNHVEEEKRSPLRKKSNVTRPEKLQKQALKMLQ